MGIQLSDVTAKADILAATVKTLGEAVVVLQGQVKPDPDYTALAASLDATTAAVAGITASITPPAPTA